MAAWQVGFMEQRLVPQSLTDEAMGIYERDHLYEMLRLRLTGNLAGLQRQKAYWRELRCRFVREGWQLGCLTGLRRTVWAFWHR